MRGRAKTNKGGGNPSLKLGYYSNWNICRLTPAKGHPSGIGPIILGHFLVSQKTLVLLVAPAASIFV